jgi:chitosanase
MNEENKKKIQAILNYWETGSLSGDYGCVSVFKDGWSENKRHRVRQITYGRSQTTEQSGLKQLLELYLSKDGAIYIGLREFLPKIKLSGESELVDNIRFREMLQNAGRLDPLMQAAQDEFFDEYYWKPACKFFEENGFTLPLSMLVIYDSQIHSGGIDTRVGRSLRSRFKEPIPKNGGREKIWLASYVLERHNWLWNKSELLRKTTYRTEALLKAIKDENWNLEKPFEYYENRFI